MADLLFPVQAFGNLGEPSAFNGKEDAAMTTSIIAVTNGPDKSDLLRAVANPELQLNTIFDTPDGVIEVHIETVEERGEGGVGFTVWGRLASTSARGAFFTGSYNCATRLGRLALKKRQ